MDQRPPHKHPPPWLFGIVGIPYGVGGTFVAIVMPFLASRAKLDFGEIGWFGTLLFVPPIVQFLYAPVVDIGPKRKHWLVLVSVLGALCFMPTFFLKLPDQKVPFLLFAFFGQFVTGLTGSCNGGLLALTMPDEKRGAASAWLNVSNLAGGALVGWATIEMLGDHVSPYVVGGVYAAMIILPALPILLIEEPERERRVAGEVFGDMWHGVTEVLMSKKGLTGFLLCLSPVGTAALTNYFSAMGTAFGASDRVVGIVVGPANAILTSIGAFVGGWLCDRVNRRSMYLLSGALTAVCGISMALGPHTALTYEWGVGTYLLVTGFCYAAFTATVLDTIGAGGKAASTRYALFVAAGNAAIGYTGFIDTRFGGHVKLATGKVIPVVTHVIASDATLNLLGVAVLGLVFWRLGFFAKKRLAARAAAAPAE